MPVVWTQELTAGVPVTVNDSQSVDPVTQQRVLDVLRLQPAGLFTDIDGTISAIAATPTEAVVTVEAREALRRLADRLAVVGAVTGRAADDGALMLDIPGLLVVGNHGMEWLHQGQRWINPAAAASTSALAAALTEVGEVVTVTGLADGVVLEDKRLSASIHYRLATDPISAREAILAAAEAAAERHGLRITEGRFVVELRPKVVINKGTAIAELVRERSLNGIVFFGDDITDVDAFVAMRTLRESGAVSAQSIAVLSAETHPSVVSMADVTVQGVSACIELLTYLAEALEANQP